jgi:hypothetical protein
VRFLLDALRRVHAHPDAVVYTRGPGRRRVSVADCPSDRRPRVVYESHGIAAGGDRPKCRRWLLGQAGARAVSAKAAAPGRRERRVWTRGGGLRRDHARTPATTGVALWSPAKSVRPCRTGRAGATEPGNNARRGRRGRGLRRPPLSWKGVDVFVRALAMHAGVRGAHRRRPPRRSRRAQRDTDARSRVGSSAIRIEMTGLVPPGEVGRARPRDILVLPIPRSDDLRALHVAA